MDRFMVLVLTVLLCLAHSTPLQQPVVERSSRRPPPQERHQHPSEGNAEGESQEYYNRGDSAEGTEGREGARRRRLTTATATKVAANEPHQYAREPRRQQEQGATGEQSTTAGAEAAESRPAAAAAAAATTGRSHNTISRTVRGVQGSEAALGGVAVGSEARVQGFGMDIIQGEVQGAESDSTVEAVEGGGAEEDKGIEEGEEGGFVVVARDGEEEGEPGDSVDNDKSSTNGISNNIMVIVFCALAFVANGGFLVYVFWVM